jgi:putative FmdB family regulatory protein
MPTYVFRCAAVCPDFTGQYTMAAVPDAAGCPGCGADARRIIGAPALGVGSTAAMRLQDRTRATADRPEVVSGPPPSQRARAAVTTNPLHRKLPRP